MLGRMLKNSRERSRRISAGAAVGASVAGCLLAVLASACGEPLPVGEVARVDDRTIEFSATVSVAAFDGDFDMAGYHLLVWADGRSSDRALLRAHVSDVEVLDALEGLGAVPGNAVGIDAWDERNDADSSAADTVVEGPRVEVTVLPAGGAPLTLDDILVDPGGRGFDMRFGGHRANIPAWLSGCVVCLYSCPGSKVGNAAYTVRDHVDGTTRFSVRPEVLPPDGTEVTVRIELRE